MTYINQTTEKYVPGTNMSHKFHKYTTCTDHLMCIYGWSMPICMPHKKALWSKLWSVGRPQTDGWMHHDCTSWPTKSAKKKKCVVSRFIKSHWISYFVHCLDDDMKMFYISYYYRYHINDKQTDFQIFSTDHSGSFQSPNTQWTSDLLFLWQLS